MQSSYEIIEEMSKGKDEDKNFALECLTDLENGRKEHELFKKYDILEVVFMDMNWLKFNLKDY